MSHSTMFPISVCAALFVAISGCSSSKSDPAPASQQSGVVSGATDTHCNGKPAQEVSAASCHPTDDGGTHHHGEADAGAAAEDPYPATMYNAEADDDDCKYHVKWSATSVAKDTDVTFTVTLTKKGDGSPATGATPYAEVYLDENHLAPNSNAKAAETSPGTYTIGPIKFDTSGKWTTRFHFFGDCEDAMEDSPHGHAAFFVAVP